MEKRENFTPHLLVPDLAHVDTFNNLKVMTCLIDSLAPVINEKKTTFPEKTIQKLKYLATGTTLTKY